MTNVQKKIVLEPIGDFLKGKTPKRRRTKRKREEQQQEEEKEAEAGREEQHQGSDQEEEKLKVNKKKKIGEGLGVAARDSGVAVGGSGVAEGEAGVPAGASGVPAGVAAVVAAVVASGVAAVVGKEAGGTTGLAGIGTVEDVASWSFTQVWDWLKKIGFEQYADKFLEEEIDGEALVQVLGTNGMELLQSIGVSVGGHRFKILGALKKITEQKKEF